MRQTWRWFGPSDLASIDDMAQSGVEGVVTALHHVPTGAVWLPDDIALRQSQVRAMRDGSPSGLEWEVVESLPVSEDIKKQKGDWRTHIENYRLSLENLAAAGISTVCYNFMPVLDWTRTDLHFRLPHGGTAMRFDAVDFAAFDLFILERAGASHDYADAVAAEAERRFAGMTEARKSELVRNVTAGLPGATEHLSLADVRAHLADYAGLDADRLRAHFTAFLEEIVPTAERLGIRLGCHPDDPPFQLLGLPRIMSCEADYASMLGAVDSPANGMTLCSGSLGVRPENDLSGMMERLGPKVHFIHLRNVARETGGPMLSFHESEHLGGDVDMVGLVGAILAEERRRRQAGRSDHEIPMRPDHGQDILFDIGRGGQPGYPVAGRMRGLAELRGVIAGLRYGAGD